MKKSVKLIKSVLCFLTIAMCISLLFSCARENVSIETTESAKIEETTTTPSKEIAFQGVDVKKIDKTIADNNTNYLSVKFGTYGENIEWLVIDKNDDTALLLSKKILDCKNYNEENTEVTWENSDLRKWLNDEFINTAFTSEEQKLLCDMSAYESEFIKGDKVSLLKVSMCKKYFDAKVDSKQNKKLTAKATDYAKNSGLECDDNVNTDFYDCGSYYLYDNGVSLDKAAWVGQHGRIYVDGQAVKLEIGDGVRPIICVKSEVFTNGVIDSINANIFHIDISKTVVDVAEKSESAEEIETSEITAEDDMKKNYTYSNVAKASFQSNNVPCSEKNVVDLALWKYGRTPVEWVYVLPNTQLLSNSSPNKSSKFGYKVKASSGPKGCYMVAFTSCDELKGSDYDGRLFCFEDYTKIPLDELKFNNKFEELQYEGYNVLELLKKRYEMTDISNGVYMAGDVYVNIIYVDELDDIIVQGK